MIFIDTASFDLMIGSKKGHFLGFGVSVEVLKKQKEKETCGLEACGSSASG